MWTASAAAQGTCGNCYNAKIATEDGSPLPAAPQIVPAFTNKLYLQCIIHETFGNGNVLYQTDPRLTLENQDADACTVKIALAGYHSVTATLRPNSTIVVKRVGDHDGSAVSLVSLQAPREAKKAYDKGAVALTRGEFAKAQKNFESATALYPQYAQAWSSLSETFSQQSQPKPARDACERAIQADPKYLKSYVQLARLDLSEGRQQDALEVTERAIALNPVEFPAIYFYNAVANVNLKHLSEAETSARMAIQLDAIHEIPRSEHLLGTLLAAKGDIRGAIEHLHRYLAISPQATDAPEVRKQILLLQQKVPQ